MMAAIARTVFTIWTPRRQNNPDPVERIRMFEPDCARRNLRAETARLLLGWSQQSYGLVHAMLSALWIEAANGNPLGKWRQFVYNY